MRNTVAALLSALLLIPAAAHADAGAGYVGTFSVLSFDHSIIFYQSGSRNNVPGCAANNPGRWAFDFTTPSGQMMMANLLTANALHKQVAVTGTGDCSAHSDTETVLYLTVSN